MPTTPARSALENVLQEKAAQAPPRPCGSMTSRSFLSPQAGPCRTLFRQKNFFVSLNISSHVDSRRPIHTIKRVKQAPRHAGHPSVGDSPMLCVPLFSSRMDNYGADDRHLLHLDMPRRYQLSQPPGRTSTAPSMRGYPHAGKKAPAPCRCLHLPALLAGISTGKPVKQRDNRCSSRV